MGVQCICEQRSEVFVKIQKKWGVRSGEGGGVGGGGQGGCERRIEVCVKIQKKIMWGGGGHVRGGGRVGGGVRLALNEELKF